jgi:preprotein translocase subunit SecG
MATVVLTVHMLLALALILVVLLQRSEGGGLGIGGGGGIMTSRGAATALSKLTWALGIAFVVTSLALTVLAARDSASDSVIDSLGAEAPPAPAGTTTPDLGDDLLPPTPAAPAPGGPATPPAEGPATPPPVE